MRSNGLIARLRSGALSFGIVAFFVLATGVCPPALAYVAKPDDSGSSEPQINVLYLSKKISEAAKMSNSTETTADEHGFAYLMFDGVAAMGSQLWSAYGAVARPLGGGMKGVLKETPQPFWSISVIPPFGPKKITEVSLVALW